MIASRILLRSALVASIALVAGCGGTPSEVDTAELIRTEPTAKAAPEAPPTAVSTPDAVPAKEAPKN